MSNASSTKPIIFQTTTSSSTEHVLLNTNNKIIFLMQYRALNIKTSKELFHTTLHIWNSFDENYIKSIPHQLLAVIKSKLRPPHKALIKLSQLFKQITCIVCFYKTCNCICLPFENCEYFVIALNTLRFVFICPRYHIFKRSQSVVLCHPKQK